MLKKAIFILIPLLLIGSHLSHRIRTWYRVNQDVARIKNNINHLEKEHEQLKRKKNYFQTEEFIRREAREKLGLTNKDDLVLVLPELPDLPEKRKGKQTPKNSPVWKQWWDLFFSKS